MAEVVNLRRARKTQERMRRQAVADQARIKHGRSASERALAREERERAQSRLDAHKIDNEHEKPDG